MTECGPGRLQFTKMALLRNQFGAPADGLSAKGRNIENQRHAPVAKNRRPGNTVNPLKQTPERLDHSLLLAQQFIGGQPRPSPLIFDDNNFFPLRRFSTASEQIAELYV